MSSNSSRFLWRLRKAAARFLTSRASRLLRPETSGGTKSLVLMHARGFFADEAAEAEAGAAEERFAEDGELEFDGWDELGDGVGDG